MIFSCKKCAALVIYILWEVIIINLLFWNLAKNSIDNFVSDIIEENDIDIGVFAEFEGININAILKKLNGKYNFIEGMGACGKIIMIAKSNYDIQVIREQNRYIIYSVYYKKEYYILVGLHLQDNLYSDEASRKLTIRNIVYDIEAEEKTLKHSNTIVMGDFNASPFDSELIQKDSFNAVLFKDLILKSEYVNFENKTFRRFYNPMLNYISEDNFNYGSIYYGSGIKTLYWYCYDQVLVRRDLIDQLIDVSYCKFIKNKKLLSNVCPDKAISDHLPLIVKFERRITDV